MPNPVIIRRLSSSWGQEATAPSVPPAGESLATFRFAGLTHETDAIKAAIGDVWTEDGAKVWAGPTSTDIASVYYVAFASGNLIGVDGALTWLVSQNPRFRVTFRPDNTANVVYWLGWFSGTIATQMASNAPAQPHAGFLLDVTGTGVSNWQAAVSDGSTQNRVDTGIAPTTTSTLFGIDLLPTGCNFKINGSTVANLSANLPAGTDLVKSMVKGKLGVSAGRYVYMNHLTTRSNYQV